MQPSEDLEEGSGGQSAAPAELDTTTQPVDTDASGLSPSDDWTSHLDGGHSVEVLEFRLGSRQWEAVPITEITDPLLLVESVLIRLYLVEGLTQETISYFSGIDENFFRYHYLNVLPYDQLVFSRDYFFSKWPRRVYQNRHQWDIEDRIAKGRPYSSDTIIDPREIRLEHDRYERPLGIHRPHSSLEATPNLEKKYIRQALGDCISIFYKKVNNGLIGELPPIEVWQLWRPMADRHGILGVLMFDAPHKVRVIRQNYGRTTKKSFRKGHKVRVSQEDSRPTTEDSATKGASLQDCFSRFTPSRQRFREQLLMPENFAALTGSPEHSIRVMILRFILTDHMEIMSDFREALDFIDENLSNDDVLRSCLQDWRKLFGQWKRSFSNDVSSIAYVIQALPHEPGLDTNVENAVDPTLKRIGRTISVLRLPVQADFDKLTGEVKNLTERAESTFQAIMATMTILESQKAIAQAETISKLTNLAFFFIPLTLCASIFGMNIVVSSPMHTYLYGRQNITYYLIRNGGTSYESGPGYSFPYSSCC